MLKRSKELIQAYKETPWRRQMQMISFVAGVVVVLALIAAVYLNITARSATTGRLVQQLQSERADLEQHIEDMRTQLAFILSAGPKRVEVRTTSALGWFDRTARSPSSLERPYTWSGRVGSSSRYGRELAPSKT